MALLLGQGKGQMSDFCKSICYYGKEIMYGEET